MPNLEDKYKVAIIISLIIGFSVLGFAFLNYKSDKEALEQKARSEEQIRIEENSAKVLRQLQIEACIKDVEERLKSWATSAPKNTSDEAVVLILGRFDNEKEECYKKYPVQ